MTFEITRTDGRSNQQVLIDTVKNEEPGRLFTYDELKQALGFDSRVRVQRTVIAAQHRLLKEFCRTLDNVRGEGYRIAKASEHTRIASSRKRRAENQLRRGLHVLRNVRWEEMDADARAAHEGTLMVSEALYRIQTAQDARITRIEEAIRKAGIE